uniref:Uncharacterized protein n=1 Tax=Guillardia theta TaxID=55529 RepID=A0A7S4PKP5_GUITH|mmetsp:Transcript_52296/g.162351  ORF Transcript_52296/g.162351 Transcript_52296/m.162351 type:complete len:439 (+) Transcript_52296:45-1361(+)
MISTTLAQTAFLSPSLLCRPLESTGFMNKAPILKLNAVKQPSRLHRGVGGRHVKQELQMKAGSNHVSRGLALLSTLAVVSTPLLSSGAPPPPPVEVSANFQNPYLLLEPAGESYLGKKGINLQMPSELSDKDEAPLAYTMKKAAKPKINYIENLSNLDIAASFLWTMFLYFGIFDINYKDNVIRQAGGVDGDVRPSDWVNIKLGKFFEMEQETWKDDWRAPVPLQMFTFSLFFLAGLAIERGIVVGAGDVNGFFAFSAALSGCIWAGVYELGRTQQRGYRLTREEQEAMDQEWKDFCDFAQEQLEVKPNGRVYVGDVMKAFRRSYGKYRTSEQLSDEKLKGYFRRFARNTTGMKGKQGFYKGIALVQKADAFGYPTAQFRWAEEEKKRRDEEVRKAREDAAEAARMAEEAAMRARENADDTVGKKREDAEEKKRSQEV